MTLLDLILVMVMTLSFAAAAFLAGRYASPRRHPHSTRGTMTMSQVTDAFAAYEAYRDSKEAAAVAAAVEAEKANQQANIDAAVAAAEAADAAVIAAATPAS